MTQMELIGRLAGSAAVEQPDYLADSPFWVEHLPFAFWLIDAIRPHSFVELGTASGVSFCGFCQQVLHSEAPTACYAVGAWADPAGAEAHARFQAHHDSRYRGFSQILRSTNDDALAYFIDGSIDLLHITGEQGGSAARHDFDTWLPKLSRRAVVLLHRTNRREQEDPVWPLWNELSQRYPAVSFVHGEGLGVLAVGGEVPDALQGLMDRLGSVTEEATTIRAFFAQRGADLLIRHENGVLARRLAATGTEAAGLRETLARQTTEAAAGQSEILRLVGEITVRDAEIGRLNHEIIQRDGEIGRRDGEIGRLTPEITVRDAEIERLNHEIIQRDGEIGRLVPEITVRDTEIGRLNHEIVRRDGEIGRLSGEITVRDTEIGRLNHEIIRRDDEIGRLSGEIERLVGEIAGRDAEIGRLVGEVTARDAEIGRLNREAAAHGSEIGELRQEIAARDAEIGRLGHDIAIRDGHIAHLGHEIAAREAHIARLGHEVAGRDSQIASRDDSLQRLAAELDGLHRRLAGMYASTSWKVARPVRAIKVIAKRLTGSR